MSHREQTAAGPVAAITSSTVALALTRWYKHDEGREFQDDLLKKGGAEFAPPRCRFPPGWRVA